MPLPRKVLVNERVTPYYHCVSRCVRRAFLCGRDPVTGQNFSHRKRWVVQRLRQLARVFAVEVCAYAVLSNHVHLVVRLAPRRAKRWSERKVVRRWTRIFRGSSRRLRRMGPAERQREVEVWRERLADLSWFMRCLNEHIARRANREDGCTGRFWEGRFRSQALMDEGAVLTCMSYVDLNPLRAGLARTLRGARFTSVRERLCSHPRCARDWLVPFVAPAWRGLWRWGEPESEEGRAVLPMEFGDYVAVLEGAAAALAADRHEVGNRAGAVLRGLGISEAGFVWALKRFSRVFSCMVGRVHRIRLEARERGLQRSRGVAAARQLYLEAGDQPAAA